MLLAIYTEMVIFYSYIYLSVHYLFHGSQLVLAPNVSLKVMLLAIYTEVVIFYSCIYISVHYFFMVLN